MLKTKSKPMRSIAAAALSLVFFLLSYEIARYGLPISIAISSLLYPLFLAMLSQKGEVFDFYGKHLQIITAALFLVLPTVLTVLLGGYLGVMLLYEIPLLFILVPALLALILTEAGVILVHRVIVYRVVKEERSPECILRTRKMFSRILITIFAAFLALPILIDFLGSSGMKQAVVPVFWLYAFVFWSYFYLLPISLGIFSNYKQVRLGLKVAISGFQKLTQYSSASEKNRILTDMVWLKDSLRAYNKLMSSQPNRPVLANVKEYCDATVAAVLGGTRKDQRRLLEALESMLEALGKEKSQINFQEFLFSLIRMTKAKRITSDDVKIAIKTESRTEWIEERCRNMVIYVVPVVALVVAIVVPLWLKS